MRKAFTTLSLFFFLCLAANAQKADGVIKGRLVDTTTKQPISDATVSLLQARDSVLVSFTLSNKQGNFEIKGILPGQYRLLVTHEAFVEVKRDIAITDDKKQVDLGEVNPSKNYKELGGVTVSNEAPIVVKNDTIQFNASGFKTQPNATAEDLIKKLPGMEVDREGNVKSQGEQVQKVLVDGKEFFGNDPKLATKNLTADMIESVQVFDDMSEQSKFTRIDDGSRSKTLNIKLKKDRNKGYFGRASLGYGSSERYEGNLSLNKFNGDQRLSVLFNANNINKQGFSFSDIISSMGGFSGFGGGGGGGGGMMMGGGGFGGGGGMMGGMQMRGGGMNFIGGGGGGSTGIIKSLSAGLNYSDLWGSKIKVTGSYFFSDSKSQQEVNSFRQTTYKKRFTGADSIANLTRENRSVNDNQNHRFNIRFEYQIDSMN